MEEGNEEIGYVWKKNVAWPISKQRMLQPSSLHITAAEGEPWGNWGWKWNASHQAVTPAVTPIRNPSPLHPRRLRRRKHRIMAPLAEVHTRGMVSMSPDSCIFPDIEKHWTWDIWFSLTVIFWTSDYLVFVARTPIYSGSSSTSSEQSLRDIWETVSPTSVLSFVCWIKDYSQLLGCAFHFQLTRIDYEVQTSSYKRKVTGM